MFRYKNLWEGCAIAVCPSYTGPTGARLINFGRHGGSGILTNTNTETVWNRSQGQYSLAFDGVDDYVAINRGQFDWTPQLSVSCWTKITSHTTFDRQTILEGRMGAGAQRGICIFHDNQVATNGIAVGSIDTGAVTQLIYSANNVVTMGQWVHVCFVWKSTAANQAFIYINGKLSGTGTLSLTLTGATESWRLGNTNFPSTSLDPHDGNIDDLRIYNRALTNAEIVILSRRRGIAYTKKPVQSFVVHPQAQHTTTFSQSVVLNKVIGKKKLLSGRVAAWCPSKTGPTGTKLFDLTGRNNIGTLTNMDAASDWLRSGGRYALDFDGTNDYISTTCTVKDGVGSISGWFKCGTQTSDVGSLVRPIVWQGVNFVSASSGEGLKVSMIRNGDADHGKLLWHWGNGLAETRTALAYNDSMWHHFVMVNYGSTASLYIDGISVQSISSSTSLDKTRTFEIGGSTTSTARKIAGQIDDIAIYNRSLNAGEVQALYKLGRGGIYTNKRTYSHNYLSFSHSPYSGPSVHRKTKRKKKLLFPTLSYGRTGAWCPSLTGPTGNKLFDLSGKNNHATLNNMAPATDWITARGKYALDFDGTDDYASTARPMLPTGTNTYSISGWVYIRSFAAYNAWIYAGGDSSTQDQRIDISLSNKLMFASYKSGGGADTFYNTTALSTNQWYHIVGIRDASKMTLSIYINGKQDGSISLTSANAGYGGGTNRSYIGWLGLAGSYYSNQQTDDVAIYNRALSPAEIAALSIRRGIAYEQVNNSNQYLLDLFASSSIKRNLLLLGVG